MNKQNETVDKLNTEISELKNTRDSLVYTVNALNDLSIRIQDKISPMPKNVYGEILIDGPSCMDEFSNLLLNALRFKENIGIPNRYCVIDLPMHMRKWLCVTRSKFLFTTDDNRINDMAKILGATIMIKQYGTVFLIRF